MATTVPMTGNSSDTVEYICNKYAKLDAAMGVWKTHWKTIAKYTMPNKDFVFGGQVPGEMKDWQLYDAIGVHCVDRLSAAFHGMLTNPASVWFSLSCGDPLIDSLPAVAKWLQDSARLMISVMNNSNFQSEIHEVYQELCSIGTGHMKIEEDELDVVRFTSRPIYESAVSENHLGIIDTHYYKYEYTLDQLSEAYPDTIPKELEEMRFKDPLKKVCIIHAIEPSNRLPPKLRHAVLPITSIHVLKEWNVILKKSGFEENPCITPRMSKISGEMLGRSPAMKALPDIMMADAMMKAFIEQAQVVIAPPLQVPDEGVLLPVKLEPRGTNYYRAGTKDRIEPLNIGGNLSIGDDILERVHAKIKQAFYIDQLHLVENDRMTTVEVMQRRDEYLRTMSPILGRLQNEFLRPTVQRVFGIMARRGLFPALPPELKDKKLEIKFVSQLARAQESVDAENFMRSWAMSMEIAKAQPQVLDLINGDKAVNFAFKSYGTNLSLLNEQEAIDKMRQSRAQQLEEERQIANSEVQSKTAVNVAKAAQE